MEFLYSMMISRAIRIKLHLNMGRMGCLDTIQVNSFGGDKIDAALDSRGY